MSWQKEVPDMSGKLAYLLKTERRSDVTLIVGKGPQEKRIKAHRLILSAYSEVFEAMFYGKLSNEEEQVTFPEDDPNSFEVMIRYIYTGEVEIPEEAVDLLLVADKYRMSGMKRKCIDYLSENISSDTVILTYETASSLNEIGLTLRCWKHIISHTSEVLKQNSFLYSSASTVTRIMAAGSLCIESEIELYKALLKWGRYRCEKRGLDATDWNVREDIDGAIGHIKFLEMTPEVFVCGPARDDVLSQEEKLVILENIIKPGIVDLPEDFSTNINKRNYIFPGKEWNIVFEGSRNVSAITFYSAVTFREKIIFPYRDVYLSGFKIHVSDQQDRLSVSGVKCNLFVETGSKSYEMGRNDLILYVDKDHCIVEIFEPVLVTRGSLCDILLTITHEHNETLYCCSGNCALPSDVAAEVRLQRIGDFAKPTAHFHGILMWHISEGVV